MCLSTGCESTAVKNSLNSQIRRLFWYLKIDVDDYSGIQRYKTAKTCHESVERQTYHVGQPIVMVIVNLHF